MELCLRNKNSQLSESIHSNVGGTRIQGHGHIPVSGAPEINQANHFTQINSKVQMLAQLNFIKQQHSSSFMTQKSFQVLCETRTKSAIETKLWVQVTDATI
jgi:hypothetical protein